MYCTGESAEIAHLTIAATMSSETPREKIL